MLPFKFSLGALLIIMATSFSAYAQYNNNGAEMTPQFRNDVPPPHHGYNYQCSAHSSHDEHHIYYGDIYKSRRMAQQSAVHECEHHEGHECVPHECRRVW